MIWRWLLVLWVAVWAIPIWLLFLLPAWGLGLLQPWGRVRGPVVGFLVTYPENRLGRWWESRWHGWSGLAMPCAIMVTTTTDDSLIAHELRHTDQWLWLGPLFPFVYGILLAAQGYHKHALEADARDYAARTVLR